LKVRKGRNGMALSDDQIQALVRALSVTREHEIDCSECREEYEALFSALERMQEQEREGRPD
jgi:hypothetical protein